MQKYYLFLDEILPNVAFDHFCLAGIAISEAVYLERLTPEVNALKEEIFQDQSIILHEKEVHTAESGTPFAIMQKQTVRMLYWSKIIKLFLEHEDLKVFCVAVHQQAMEQLYANSRDRYFVALQVIMENFVHFLEGVNGIGDLVVEARDDKSNAQLQQHFHWLKATGTLFYDSATLQKRLYSISFPRKKENCIGLQVADHVPNSLNRFLNHKKQKTFGLIDAIQKRAYDGGIDRTDRFGIKLIP